MANNPSQKECVLILGMHRSGTSLCASMVHALGYSLGKTMMPKSYDNVYGFYENQKVVDTNDSLLTDLDSAWDQPPTITQLNDLNLEGYKDHIDQMMSSEFSDTTKIVIKDPRISLLSSVWTSYLSSKGYNIKLILCDRSPEEVIRSLKTRNNFSSEKSDLLYGIYQSRALRLIKNRDYDSLLLQYPTNAQEYDTNTKMLCGFTNTVVSDRLKNLYHPPIKTPNPNDSNPNNPTEKLHKEIKSHRPHTTEPKEITNFTVFESTLLHARAMEKPTEFTKVFLVDSTNPAKQKTYNFELDLSKKKQQISIDVESDQYNEIRWFPLNFNTHYLLEKFVINGSEIQSNKEVLTNRKNDHVKHTNASPIKTISIAFSIVSKVYNVEFLNTKEALRAKDNHMLEDISNNINSLVNNISGIKEDLNIRNEEFRRKLAQSEQKMTDSVQSLTDKIKNLESTKNELLRKKDDQILQKESKLDQQKRLLVQKDNQLDHQKNLLIQKENQIDQQNQLLAQKDNQLDQQKNILIQKENQNIALQAQLSEQIHRQHLEIQKFKTDYTDRENEADQVKNELYDIRQSLSYKLGRLVTWPIRIPYDLLFDKRNKTLKTSSSLLTLLIQHPIKVIGQISLTNFKILRTALRHESAHDILRNAKKKIGIPLLNRKEFTPDRLNTAPVRKKVLYISPNLPDYDTSSGGKRATRQLEIIHQMADVVVFTLGERPEKYIQKLESVGAKVIRSDQHSELLKNHHHFDTIIFAWFYTLHDNSALLSHYKHAKVIVDSVDVHWVRESRSIGEVAGLTIESVERNKHIEIEAYKNADQIWAVSNEDLLAIHKELPSANVSIVSNIHEIEVEDYTPKDNHNILFFGGYNHPPNLSAIKVLAEEILPHIRNKIPHATLIIAGANAPDEVKALGELPGVIYKGFIEEEEIPTLYAESKVVVAPLSAGAGIKGKICEAIAYKVPVVTTEIGNEGIGLEHMVDGIICQTSLMSKYIIDILQDKLDLESMTSLAQDKLIKIVGTDAARANMRADIYDEVIICIVTWNRLKLLEDCLHSIQEHTTYPNYKVLIYSNGCEDGTAEYLEELNSKDPRFVPILSPTNDVFVLPNNRMMQSNNMCDVVLLNNDTIVTQGWLSALRAGAYTDNQIGIAGSKLLYPDGRLQEFGSELYTNGTGMNHGKFGDPSEDKYNSATYVGYVSGCSMYIKRSTIDRIGYFDEQFHPCYCEDSDYAYTAWENNIRTIVLPNSIVYHLEGGTSGTDTSTGFKAYQQTNMKKFLAKHGDTLKSIQKKISTINEQK